MKKRSILSILSCLSFISLIALQVPVGAHGNNYVPHLLKGKHQRVCDAAAASMAGCFARVETDKSNNPAVTTLPAGYGPAQFHGAYQTPGTSLNPGTIAVVAAYDAPNIVSDLATYNKTFGLPVFPSCSRTVTAACFQKVDQNGGTNYPQRNSGWALEISMDVEMAHQTCQNCKLILVEASSASYTNLMKAVDRARQMGATVVSNSYGSNEFSGETAYDNHFNFPGVAFVFSSGDSGYGASYPAGSPFVTAAGGTTLNITAANAWQAETVWNGSGSGCSAYELKPSFQTDTGCLRRSIADVAADADPNTGAAVYDSYSYQGMRGWFQVGGTSLSAPLIAGMYGLANNVALPAFANSVPYANFNYASNLHDVTVGTNGNCGTYLCQGTAGYDGPTGLGSPLGLGAL
ncbi:MAG TPA: S53 family peptidase [Candidatus Saccharimonadales bacterium]|nr:S53 family peptidase [Candidatus Saccharimonadales bacterium]